MLENSVYFDIKQRSGFLPYKEDNNHYSMVASSLVAADDCLPWSADVSISVGQRQKRWIVKYFTI